MNSDHEEDEYKKKTKEDIHCKYNSKLCFFLFFILGNFNNSAYVVVTAAA